MDGVLVVVPPDKAEKVVREAHEAGIQRVCLQREALRRLLSRQRAESDERDPRFLGAIFEEPILLFLDVPTTDIAVSLCTRDVTKIITQSLQ